MSRKCVMLASALAGLVFCGVVSGQTPNDGPLERAARGQLAFEAGRYEQAAELLSDVLRTYPLPSIAYRAGQAQEKLKRLVQAIDLYRMARELEPSWQGKVTGEALEKQETARSEAAEALDRLQARIPQLSLRVESAVPGAVTVTVDAVEIAAASLGRPRPLNPGLHVVQATAECGDQDVVQSHEVTLEEGKRQELVLKPVCPVAASPPTAPRTTPRLPSTALAGQVPESEPGRAPLLMTLGWVGIGVGSAGLVASAVTALAGKSILDSECNDDLTCDYEHADDHHTYESLRTWSTVTFWVGLPVLAAGGAALYWDQHERDETPTDQGLTAWVGLGSVGLGGRFQ